MASTAGKQAAGVGGGLSHCKKGRRCIIRDEKKKQLFGCPSSPQRDMNVGWSRRRASHTASERRHLFFLLLPPLPPSPSSSSPSSSCSSSSSSSSPYSSFSSSFSSSALVRPEACSPTRHIISAGWSSPLSSLSGVPVGLFEWISCGSPERVAVCVCEGVKAADDSRQPQQGRRG